MGRGGTPFHTGVGLLVNGRHFIGWNSGQNPLPLVLARDVASAVVAACKAEGLEGRSYNLAGDVRLTAREYVRELSSALGRPFVYHPRSTEWQCLTEAGKWLIKRASGRSAWRPTYRDLRSRAFLSEIDTDDAKRELGWAPVRDRARFIEEAIAVHVATHREIS
jgi:uncharacterized protein YbjT (DUF2867 family)